MGTLEEIRDLLKRYTAGEIQTFPATVVSMDNDKYTAIVQPTSGEPELKVRLKAAINSQPAGIVAIPKEGSTVLVALIFNNPDTAYVCAVDEIDKVEIRAEVIINDGENGGLIRIEALKEEYRKTKELLDALMTIISGAPIPEPGAGSPSALQAALNTATVGKGTGSFEDVENPKVKH